ncbi:MAG: fructosamine kinase family protein [bacterium]|nr:fructosamine kinase family protein [bacterium]
MPQEEKFDDSLNKLKPIPLFNIPVRNLIEKAVSEYIGRKWRIKSAKDMSDFACHPCAIFSGDSFKIFAKYGEEPEAPAQFEIELTGLQYLLKNAGTKVPIPISIVQLEKGTLLIMEGLDAIEREGPQWRDIGKTLACIHRVKSDICGFPSNGFWGPLSQDNTQMHNWMVFFRECRLLPMLKIAIDSGNLPTEIASRVENVIQRLPEFCGGDFAPALLHGDAQQNNFISTREGTYVIDPAVYYGNPEMDIALIDSWQPVPMDVFEGYEEEMPIDPGFSERRNLWRIPLYLAAVALEGQQHLSRLTNAMQQYL